MISFLHPVAFWLGLCAFIPLIIHLLGKTRTRKIQFPSLLLFQKQLVKATKKQRIKNYLLLALFIFLVNLKNIIFRLR